MMPVSLAFGDFVLDPAQRRLWRSGEPVELNSRYFDALALLAREPGILISKDRFMAEVWRGRATAVGGFEKPVAIKKILPHLVEDPRFVRLLIGEAKLLANLRQRNIVQVYDVGVGDDGGFFVVLEFVDGKDIAALCERMEAVREPFPRDLALHVAAEVCDALEVSEGNQRVLLHRARSRVRAAIERELDA